jgi:hypothetical protein
MYRAIRPHSLQRNVTWLRGGAGTSLGVRSIGPEQDGQLNDVPVRSFAMRFRACAGLYVAGRGLRIYLSSTTDCPGDGSADSPLERDNLLNL